MHVCIVLQPTFWNCAYFFTGNTYAVRVRIFITGNTFTTQVLYYYIRYISTYVFSVVKFHNNPIHENVLLCLFDRLTYNFNGYFFHCTPNVTLTRPKRTNFLKLRNVFRNNNNNWKVYYRICRNYKNSYHR